jgi:hypothetical protein
MKKDEVPQDEGTLGHLKEINYAVDEHGRYVKVATTGWAPKIEANRTAWEHIQKKRRQVWDQVRSGRLSPLAWHMTYHHLEPGVLAAYVGLAGWRVKRHLKPKVFRRLGDEVLAKYARFFCISIDQLKTIPDGPGDGDEATDGDH